MNELNHTAGKGDKERSPGWRKNYDEIDFHRKLDRFDGFYRVNRGRIRKVYGSGLSTGVAVENWYTGEVECHCAESLPFPICECGAAQREYENQIKHEDEQQRIPFPIGQAPECPGVCCHVEPSQSGRSVACCVPAVPQDQFGDAAGESPRAARHD